MPQGVGVRVPPSGLFKYRTEEQGVRNFKVFPTSFLIPCSVFNIQIKAMATITQENIGLLHEKLTVKLEKTDYLPSFEKALKEYSKKANIPGFRKGMVPLRPH